MTNTEQMITVLKRWEQISADWNDKKSILIEKQYIDQLFSCSVMITNKISEAYEFIAMIEKRLKRTNDF